MSGTVTNLMPRPATGAIETHAWRDGETITFRLRVRAYGRRWRLDLGTNHEGWSQERALVELDRVQQQIARGTWQPPEKKTEAVAEPEVETFHVFASRWWARKRHELSETGRDDYQWRMDHLLPYFKDHLVVDIDARAIDAYRAHKLGERERVTNGEKLPGKRKPLGPRSINMTLVMLAQILDDAVKYELLPGNPARGKGTRVKQEKSRGSFLEPDMVIDLLDVAGEWEREPHMLPHMRYGRRAFLALLCLGGPRIEEAIAYTRGQLDLHAGVLRGGSKTAAGRDRQIDLSWFLLDELRGHVAARPSQPPDARLFPTRTGGRLNASNIRNRLLAETVKRANVKRAGEGRLLLPDKVTPHVLRRTFASLCFFAGRDPRFVMAQIGHQDARLTLQVYAQCMERRRVDHEVVWTLMRFPEESETPPSRRGFDPTSVGPNGDQSTNPAESWDTPRTSGR